MNIMEAGHPVSGHSVVPNFGNNFRIFAFLNSSSFEPLGKVTTHRALHCRLQLDAIPCNLLATQLPALEWPKIGYHIHRRIEVSVKLDVYPNPILLIMCYPCGVLLFHSNVKLSFSLMISRLLAVYRIHISWPTWSSISFGSRYGLSLPCNDRNA